VEKQNSKQRIKLSKLLPTIKMIWKLYLSSLNTLGKTASVV
jgi:hypothetical protein